MGNVWRATIQVNHRFLVDFRIDLEADPIDDQCVSRSFLGGN
jgi:hypothetical protein